MIAEGVTFSPVIDIPVEPTFKHDKIARFVFIAQPVSPFCGDNGFLSVIRFKQLLAESEDAFFAQGSDFFKILSGNLSHTCRLDAIGGDIFFKKPLKTLLSPGIRLLL